MEKGTASGGTVCGAVKGSEFSAFLEKISRDFLPLLRAVRGGKTERALRRTSEGQREREKRAAKRRGKNGREMSEEKKGKDARGKFPFFRAKIFLTRAAEKREFLNRNKRLFSDKNGTDGEAKNEGRKNKFLRARDNGRKRKFF